MTTFTNAEFKAALSELGITQAEFSRWLSWACGENKPVSTVHRYTLPPAHANHSPVSAAPGVCLAVKLLLNFKRAGIKWKPKDAALFG